MPVDAGAYIIEVVAGSPAAQAGLQKGDIIVKVGSRVVRTSEDVFAGVRSHKVGDTVTIEFYRGDTRETVEVVLVTDAAAQNASATPQSNQGQQGQALPDAQNGTADPHQGYTPQELLDMLQELGSNLSW